MRQFATMNELSAATGKHKTTIARSLNKAGYKYPAINDSCLGGKEKKYIISFLPEEYRIALAVLDSKPSLGNPTDLDGNIGAAAALEIRATRAVEKERARMAKETGLAAFEELPDRLKTESLARYSFIEMCDGFVKAARYDIRWDAERSKKGDEAFIAAYNSGKINASEDIRKVMGETTSYQTLRRWLKRYSKYGLVGLASNYHNPIKGSTSLTQEQQDFVISMMCKNPDIASKNIHTALEARYGKDIPSPGTITRFRNRWTTDNADLWLYYTDPDAWTSKNMFAFGSASIHVKSLNQLWEADSTPADLMLSDGRYSLIGMTDVYSRRLKFVVSKTSKATSVVALIRQSIIDWGVPQYIKTDNGKDYKSDHVKRVMKDLGIEQLFCTPFQGWEKPHIERAFKTFLHSLVEMMPGFIGHNVTERKVIEARRSFADRVMDKESDPVEVNMSAGELQKFCDEWVNFIYHHSSHRGLNGKKPIEMVRNWKEPVQRISDFRALDMLLMPAAQNKGIRKIGKKGVQVDGRYYQSPEYAGHVGEKVYVLLDPNDLGTAYIYLQDEDGKRTFLCPAVDPVWAGIDPATFAVLSKKHQKRVANEGRREIKRIEKTQATQSAYSEIIDSKKKELGNVVEMPGRSKEHTTDALAEGSKAVEATKKMKAEEKSVDSIERKIPASETISISETSKPKVKLLMSDSDRYVQIRDRVRGTGRGLTEVEYDWLGGYYQTRAGSMYLKLEGDMRKKYGLKQTQPGS